jgi:predicted metalloprotease with PDZ domain
MIRSLIASTILTGVFGSVAVAQQPFRHEAEAVEVRYAAGQPIVRYRLKVDSADLSSFRVTMEIRNVGDSVRLAMPAHPEYDEEYWRYVRDLSADSATIARVDSAVWVARIHGHRFTVSYRIEVPKAEDFRGAWRPYLSPAGGLVGGPYGLLYVMGAELAPTYLTIVAPESWDVATGLETTSDPTVFFAPTTALLMDSPFLLGGLRTWRFQVDGVPHRVVYWNSPTIQPFDSTAMVNGIRGLAEQAIALFGRAPYREYSFLLQDNSYGALEHLNSVTLGAPSAELKDDPNTALEEIAHEYFHNWNLMRIRPVEYTGLSYKAQAPARGLWFSEGMSIYYANLLLRRAHLPAADSNRRAHLERLFARYFNTAGNFKVSPERVSMVAYGASPEALGDYTASTHTQGEVLGNMIDLMMRDATNGRRTMDDVMRAMMERFSGVQGFTSADVFRTAAQVCGCPTERFYRDHVQGALPIDFNRYLGVIGYRMEVGTKPALGRDGQPVTDLRVWGWEAPGDSLMHLLVFDTASVWRKAGLRAGDRLLSLNGTRIRTFREFRTAVSGLRNGDSVRVEVLKPGGPTETRLVLQSYTVPDVRIREVASPTERQRRLRAAWLEGL